MSTPADQGRARHVFGRLMERAAAAHAAGKLTDDQLRAITMGTAQVLEEHQVAPLAKQLMAKSCGSCGRDVRPLYECTCGLLVCGACGQEHRCG